MFGYVGRDADGVVIKDLGLTNVDIQGARGTGSLVGRVVGDQNNLIIRCFADNGTVIGDGATGGLVGANNSYIENPSNSNDHPVIQDPMPILMFPGQENREAARTKSAVLLVVIRREKSISVMLEEV